MRKKKSESVRPSNMIALIGAREDQTAAATRGAVSVDGDLAIEGERAVGLDEVTVTADLDRAIAGVGNSDLQRCTSFIQ